MDHLCALCSRQSGLNSSDVKFWVTVDIPQKFRFKDPLGTRRAFSLFPKLRSWNLLWTARNVCVCEIRYHSCGPEFLLTSWFKQSIRCRGVQHLWHTARNEAIAIGGKGRLITSLYLQKLVLNCWTSCPFSCVYVANLRLSQKSEFPTAFPTRLTRILDLGTLKAWTTSPL